MELTVKVTVRVTVKQQQISRSLSFLVTVKVTGVEEDNVKGTGI